MAKLKLTFDTNVLIHLFDYTSTHADVPVIASIVKHALADRADIQITTRVETDLKDDREEERYKEISRRIYGVFPSVASGFRNDKGLMNGEHQKLWDELKQVVFPALSPSSGSYANNVADLDHMLAHYLNRRDIFVTADRRLSSQATTLRDVLGINVLSPSEVLEILDSQVQLEVAPHEPQPRRTDYHNPLMAGFATFDFTNNDHEYRIGTGELMFDTRWSVRNSETMCAYNYPSSIRSLAIAESVSRLKDLKPTVAYDFTSRTRDVSKGDILILCNANGYFAAIRIVSIEVKDRGGAKNELSFDYVIQTNKTHNLSELQWAKRPKIRRPTRRA